MLQGGDRLDLAQEAVGTDHGGEIGLEDLDGHLAVMAEIFSQVHRGHATLTPFPFNGVAAFERACERGALVHGRSVVRVLTAGRGRSRKSI